MKVGFVKNILREVILELKYFEKEEESAFSIAIPKRPTQTK